MSADHMPTTEMVIEGYARAPFELDIRDHEPGTSAMERKQAAQRWHAEEIRKAKVEAVRGDARALRSVVMSADISKHDLLEILDKRAERFERTE